MSYLSILPRTISFQIDPETTDINIALMKLDVDTQIKFIEDVKEAFPYLNEGYIGDYGAFQFQVDFQHYRDDLNEELLNYCRKFVAGHVNGDWHWHP